MGSKKNKNVAVAQKSVSFDPMAVTWTENYSDKIEKVWNYLPQSVGKLIAFFSVFLLGISINGDWINLAVHISRQLGYNINQENVSGTEWSLESLRLKNISHFLLFSNIISYVIYLGIGGFLHWYFYVRQRDKAEEWKCQPTKWLSSELELHEIMFGSMTLFVNASVSAFVSCFISNGGYSTVYYDFLKHGWWWLILQVPVIFIYQDYLTYWTHRCYHLPFFYKHFHKMHHKYKQPTAFSVTAIHPFEAFHIQCIMMAPLFLIPVHWLPVYIIAFYTYYHGIIDHSGINFKAQWWQPWQPDAIFHDNHHQYFHVNFSFNIFIWDKIHGTYRQKDKIYTEDIYYGKGKSLKDATNEELEADIAERKSENPLAYRSNKLEFLLDHNDLKVNNIKQNKKNKTKT